MQPFHPQSIPKSFIEIRNKSKPDLHFLMLSNLNIVCGGLNFWIFTFIVSLYLIIYCFIISFRYQFLYWKELFFVLFLVWSYFALSFYLQIKTGLSEHDNFNANETCLLPTNWVIFFSFLSFRQEKEKYFSATFK